MVYNVFGNPITDSTLEGLLEYAGKTIRRIDRAHVALNMKNAEEKDHNAHRYVKNLKAQWGTGVSTLCLIYNATGDPVTYVASHDWYGHIGPAAPYPATLANGQWGVFLHVETFGAAAGSFAGVVYRGKNASESDCDWMAAWFNPWYRYFDTTQVYTEIRQVDHFQSAWGTLRNLVQGNGQEHTDEWNGCLSTVTIGNETSPIFEAIFTLKDAQNPPPAGA